MGSRWNGLCESNPFRSVNKMKTRACVIFYNDTPELLKACLDSLKDRVDEILCIDGAYIDFPHDKPYSTDGSLEIAKQLADRVIEATSAWNSQIAKRNCYLNLSTDFKGYLLIIDADETLNGTIPKKLSAPEYSMQVRAQDYTLDQIRLIKNWKGLQYKGRHSFLYYDAALINQADYNPLVPSLDSVYLQHNFHLRSAARLHLDGEYMRNRNEIEIPEEAVCQ